MNLRSLLGVLGGIVSLVILGCTSSRSVEPDPGPAPVTLDTIAGWIPASPIHPDEDPLSPWRLLLVDGEFWGLDYGGAVIHGRPGSLEWERFPLSDGDSLFDVVDAGGDLYCGNYRRVFVFDRASKSFRELTLPDSIGVQRGLRVVGAYLGRVVVVHHYVDPRTYRALRTRLLWLTDSGWRDLYANGFAPPRSGIDTTGRGFGVLYSLIESDGKLIGASPYDIGILDSLTGKWRLLPRKRFQSGTYPEEDLATIKSLAVWNGALLAVNASPKIYAFDLTSGQWTDSLIAKRWYAPDTADAAVEGFNGNSRLYTYRDRLYLCGSWYPGGLFSAGAWVWRPELREWWHLPLLRQRGKFILTNGAQPMNDLLFVGDTMYAASIDGVWKYPLDLVP